MALSALHRLHGLAPLHYFMSVHYARRYTQAPAYLGLLQTTPVASFANSLPDVVFCLHRARPLRGHGKAKPDVLKESIEV